MFYCSCSGGLIDGTASWCLQRNEDAALKQLQRLRYNAPSDTATECIVPYSRKLNRNGRTGTYISSNSHAQRHYRTVPWSITLTATGRPLRRIQQHTSPAKQRSKVVRDEIDLTVSTSTVWVRKKSPLRFSDIFPKSWEFSVQIFQLYVPIYARLQTFVQLSATLTKLCHIKLDHPAHIICSKCPPSAETHAEWSHLIKVED